MYNNKPTPRSRLLEKLTVYKPFKKFSAFYVTQMFPAVCTTSWVFPDDEDRDGSRKVCILVIQPPVAAARPRIFYWFYWFFRSFSTNRSSLITSSFMCIYLQNLYLTVITTVNVPISRRSPGSQHATQLLTNPHPRVDNFPKGAQLHKADNCAVVQILFWVPPTVLRLPPRSFVRSLIPGKCRISSRHFSCKIPPGWVR
jgi:hypothetical protein